MENPRAAEPIFLQAPPGPRACQHLRRRAPPWQGSPRGRRQSPRRRRPRQDALEPRHPHQPPQAQVQEDTAQATQGGWPAPPQEAPLQRPPPQGKNPSRGSAQS